MKIYNIHERKINGTAQDAAVLLDGLAGRRDRLWPRRTWPPMAFDKPLGVGAKGGHGVVRYEVTEYEPGKRIVFTFTEMKPAFNGMNGFHSLEILEREGQVIIRHTIEGSIQGWALLTWPLIIRPLHDALLEDALDNAQRHSKTEPAEPAVWSLWVRLLRHFLLPIPKKRPATTRTA